MAQSCGGSVAASARVAAHGATLSHPAVQYRPEVFGARSTCRFLNSPATHGFPVALSACCRRIALSTSSSATASSAKTVSTSSSSSCRGERGGAWKDCRAADMLAGRRAIKGKSIERGSSSGWGGTTTKKKGGWFWEKQAGLRLPGGGDVCCHVARVRCVAAALLGQAETSAGGLDTSAAESDRVTRNDRDTWPSDWRGFPALGTRERKELRAYANGLGKSLVVCQIGKAGVSGSVISSMTEALEANELIKVKILDNCEDDVAEVADKLERKTKSQMVGKVGRTLLLYRPSLRKARAAAADASGRNAAGRGAGRGRPSANSRYRSGSGSSRAASR